MTSAIVRVVALSDFRPDPKGVPRIRDSKALRKALLMYRECLGCGESASDPHHVLLKSQGGDDVVANIAPLCGGDGSCHVRYHRDLTDEGKELRREIGERLRRETVLYLIEKLGRGPGLDYLRRNYVFSLRRWEKRNGPLEIEAEVA